MKILTKTDLEAAFRKIDEELKHQKEQPLRIILWGAASLLMLEIRERSTVDIDLAPNADARRFQKIAGLFGYPADIVSVSSTVDFQNCPTLKVFGGKFLEVFSVNEWDLLKLKLERFRKQDPADIDAIIKKINLTYPDFKKLALEARADFIGNPRRFSLQILQVAADHFNGEEVQDLEKILG